MSTITTTTTPAGAAEPLDYRDVTAGVTTAFGWRPGRIGLALVALATKLTRPMDQGCHEGRELDGSPHRAAWVSASPLNVFALDRAGYLARVTLAARLRHTGVINIVRIGGTADEASAALEQLVGIQARTDISLRVVPVARTSQQASPRESGSSVGARAYGIAPQSVFRRLSSRLRSLPTGRVKNCAPLVLSEWVASRRGLTDREAASSLRLELAGRIASQRRACDGPAALPAWEVRRRVLADPVLSSYMREYGLRRGERQDEVLAEARGFVDEIASDYRVGVVRWFARAVDFLFDRFLTGIDVDRRGIRFMTECDRSSRLVLVCCHKSYVDPLLIGYAMFRSGMAPPQQAAGLNLDFWPVGWLLRHSGAFYLRRTFAGETLYREVFAAYVRYLLAENFITAVYIEGTRSRDGKLATPKTGFLALLDEASRMGVCSDVTLLPVYLGYDKVPEEAAHVREMAGGRKVSESVRGLAGIYRSINNRLGKAYVRFGTPLEMRKLVDDVGLEGAALEACREIDRATPVTARSICCAALLVESRPWRSRADFDLAANVLLQAAGLNGCPMGGGADPEGVRRELDRLIAEGHVTSELRATPGLTVEEAGRLFLEYNKNLSIGHFAPDSLAALASIAEESGAGPAGEAYAFLTDLLALEFIPPAGHVSDSRTAGLTCARGVMASLCIPFVEAYRVAAGAAASIEGPVSRDEAVALCLAACEDARRRGLVTRPESSSKVALLNALKRFAQMGALSRPGVPGSGAGRPEGFAPGEGQRELVLVARRLDAILRR